MGDVRIRIEGMPEDVEAAAKRVSGVLVILMTSEDYPNRGSSLFVRRYITARLPVAPISRRRM